MVLLGALLATRHCLRPWPSRYSLRTIWPLRSSPLRPFSPQKRCPGGACGRRNILTRIRHTVQARADSGCSMHMRPVGQVRVRVCREWGAAGWAWAQAWEAVPRCCGRRNIRLHHRRLWQERGRSLIWAHPCLPVPLPVPVEAATIASPHLLPRCLPRPQQSLCPLLYPLPSPAIVPVLVLVPAGPPSRLLCPHWEGRPTHSRLLPCRPRTQCLMPACMAHLWACRRRCTARQWGIWGLWAWAWACIQHPCPCPCTPWGVPVACP